MKVSECELVQIQKGIKKTLCKYPHLPSVCGVVNLSKQTTNSGKSSMGTGDPARTDLIV